MVFEHYQVSARAADTGELVTALKELRKLPSAPARSAAAPPQVRAHCTHDWVREFPPGPRDNGGYRDVCRLCNATRE